MPNFRKTVRSAVLALTVFSLVPVSACARNMGQPSPSGQPGTPDSQAQANAAGTPGATSGQGLSAAGNGQAQMLPNGSGDGKLALKYANGEEYVNANQLMEILGMRYVWDNNGQVLKFGENDAAYEIRMNSPEARREDDMIRLKKAPAVIDGTPHIPVSALADLLSEEVAFTKEGNDLILQPSADTSRFNVDEDGQLPEGNALDFGDDTEDPYKNAASETSAVVPSDGEEDAVPAAALKDINIPALIAKARTYLGVKYEFGAAPYPQSGTFDCSSYTRYLYGRHGISLPRTSRAQGKLGNSVSRSSLRVGDLLFFYVPGRFKTNKTVGHVGIYIGNKNMINSSPLPKDGVQIINIDKAYWKETFLFAKRIAQ